MSVFVSHIYLHVKPKVGRYVYTTYYILPKAVLQTTVHDMYYKL